MEDNEEPKPSHTPQPEPDSQEPAVRPLIPSKPRPELLNPQQEGFDRAPETKKDKT